MNVNPSLSPKPGEGLALAKRNAVILAAASSVIGACAPLSVSLGAIAGDYLLEADKSLATAPVTGYTAGVAIGALPAAWLMRMIGRRYGFIGGAVITAIGGLVATAALFELHFWLFAFGLLVVGLGGSFVQQYRFAATDSAPESFKAQAISWVLIGGVFAAVIGPQTAILMKDFFAPVQFAGAFAAILVLATIGGLILSRLRIHEHKVLMDHESEVPPRPLSRVVSQQRFWTALVCSVGSYSMMSFMMTGAPLAMIGCGISTNLATLGIQWHVMAMFLPSFVTGRLIARFGSEVVIATGLAVLVLCSVIAALGIDLWNFWGALILLGIGWNFGFIGSTAMVTSTYRSSEKNKVQGFHDVILFSTVAVGSLMSGLVLNHFGWAGIVSVVWPVAVICLGLLGLYVVNSRRAGAVTG
jgi:MFS family permease